MDIDTDVRMMVSRWIVETTRAPGIAQVAARTGHGADGVRESYRRLQDKRLLVVESDGETIRMAPPFSAVPTQHRVHVGPREYFANCAWDALGIPAALGRKGTVHSRCEQSFAPLTIEVDENGPAPVPCVSHFAVPAAQWWEDIVFT